MPPTTSPTGQTTPERPQNRPPLPVVTVESVLALRPCYYASRCRELAAGRTSGTPLDVLDLEIPWRDRVWLLVRVLDRRLIETWAADCAEHVLPIFEATRPVEGRPRAAIEAVRAYHRGEIDREAVRTAAYPYAAAAAADYAAAAAADAAAAAAAADADDAAAYAADAAAAAAAAAAADADDAERSWQSDRLRELISTHYDCEAQS